VNDDDAILETYYHEQFALLAAAGKDLYGLSEKEATEVAHDILLASLHQKTPIENPATWFAATLKYVMKQRNTRG